MLVCLLPVQFSRFFHLHIYCGHGVDQPRRTTSEPDAPQLPPTYAVTTSLSNNRGLALSYSPGAGKWGRVFGDFSSCDFSARSNSRLSRALCPTSIAVILGDLGREPVFGWLEHPAFLRCIKGKPSCPSQPASGIPCDVQQREEGR